MPFKSIERITINGSNKFANGYIYGCNFQMGFSENPTQVNINLVPVDGEAFNLPTLDLRVEYAIQIGDIIFSKARLIEISEGISVGQKILNLTFVDGSIILDKIYVGLTNRHRLIPNVNPYVISVPMYCTNCNGGITAGTVGALRLLSGSIDRAEHVDVDSKDGGVIIVGIEQFVDGVCDIPEVAYNFNAILDGLNKAGISYTSVNNPNPSYLQNYTGTLREVLSNWCSDFGLSFYWNFKENKIEFLDLKNPVIDLTQIENIARTSQCVPVESINISKSLVGTYNQSIISYYLKASRSKNNTLTRYEPKIWTNVSLSQIVSEDDLYTLSSGRNEGAFKVSCTLAKFYPTARSLYNFYELGGGLPNGQIGETLGLKLVQTINIQTAADLIDAGFNIKVVEETVAKFPKGYFAVYYYSRDIESKWEDYEANIANNFLGRFYAGIEPPNDVYNCGNYAFFSRKYRSEPEGKVYSATQAQESPLSKVLTNPNGFTIENFAYITEKDAAWGTSEEELDLFFEDGDPLEGYKPIYLPIEGLTKQLLKSALQKLKISLVEDDPQGYIPVIAFIPDRDSIRRVFAVSLATANNTKTVIDDQNTEGDEDLNCSTNCEKSFVEEVCSGFTSGCSNPRPPSTGHTNRKASEVRMAILGRSKTWSISLITPSESPYRGYLEHNSETKWTIFGTKKVFGGFTKNSQTLSTRVITNNITNDYDDYFGNVNGNGITEVIVPKSDSTFGRLSLGAWHEALSQGIINNVTKPQEKITFRIIGLDFEFLQAYLTPSKGLESIQISYDENGYYADISFSTRPKELQNKETLFSKIGPKIQFNNQRAPQGSIARLESVKGPTR